MAVTWSYVGATSCLWWKRVPSAALASRVSALTSRASARTPARVDAPASSTSRTPCLARSAFTCRVSHPRVLASTHFGGGFSSSCGRGSTTPASQAVVRSTRHRMIVACTCDASASSGSSDGRSRSATVFPGEGERGVDPFQRRVVRRVGAGRARRLRTRPSGRDRRTRTRPGTGTRSRRCRGRGSSRPGIVAGQASSVEFAESTLSSCRCAPRAASVGCTTRELRGQRRSACEVSPRGVGCGDRTASRGFLWYGVDKGVGDAGHAARTSTPASPPAECAATVRGAPSCRVGHAGSVSNRRFQSNRQV